MFPGLESGKATVMVEQLHTTILPYLTKVEAIKLATVAFEKDVAIRSWSAG